MPTKLAAGLAALALLFAACGDDDDGADDATTDTTAAAASDATVDVANTSLGDVLVDAQGFTLYVFDMDEPGTSNCSGECLDSWPPAIVDEGFEVADGLDQAMFGTIDAPSGTQLTVNERPLYTFAADAAPGDVNGQAVRGVWWAVGADGNPIEG
ncbi:MAG: COG4315 family predicted lipoprotein [Jiangellaceae bacterium]